MSRCLTHGVELTTAGCPICSATQWTSPAPAPLQPWTCPKCGRVYAGYVHECAKCNREIDAKQPLQNLTGR